MKKYFIFYQQQLCLYHHHEKFILPDDLDADIKSNITYKIGIFNDIECYAIELVLIDENSKYQFFPLKSAMEKIGKMWFSAASRAHQIIRWDQNHQFCGKCGNKTHQVTHQFEKHCDHCHLSFFPKLSPAIIVLIKKENQILMARQKNFPPGVYGLIAGFVEAGESLEETVHREVYEEVGIRVNNIRYYGSQPWPFPDSLMMGFTADYESGEIACLDGELENAGWFDAGSIPGYPSSSNSIARKMIDDFLSSCDSV